MFNHSTIQLFHPNENIKEMLLQFRAARNSLNSPLDTNYELYRLLFTCQINYYLIISIT